MTRLIVLTCVAAGVVAGCGNDEPAAPVEQQPVVRNQDPWTEQQIDDALDLRKSDSSVIGADTTPSGCDISAKLTSKGAVDLYSDAGDTVVTNPDGTAGVKTSGDDPECLEEIARGLSTLRR